MLDGLIEKLGKKLDLDLKYYMKNFSYMFANNIVTIIFALALSVMLARVLSKDVFGQYNYIISIFGVLSLLSLPGMNPAITRSCARGFEGSFTEGTRYRIKYGTIGSISLLTVGLYYYIIGDFILSFGFMVSSLFFISYFSFRTFHAFLLCKKQFKKYSIYLASITIIANISTLVFAYYFRNLLIILFVLMGISSLMNLVFLYKTIKEKQNNRIDNDTIRFGKGLTLVNTVSLIKSYFDKIVVAFFLGFEALAIYSVAVIIPNQTKPLWKIITNMILPDLSKKNKVEAYSAVRKRFKYLFFLAVAIIIIGITVLPYIITFFYSEKYAESILYAQLLMLMTLNGLVVILVNLATSQRQLKKVSKILTVPPIINIVLLIILTPILGLIGTVLANVISTGIISLIFSWYIIFGKGAFISPR